MWKGFEMIEQATALIDQHDARAHGLDFIELVRRHVLDDIGHGDLGDLEEGLRGAAAEAADAQCLQLVRLHRTYGP